MSAIPNYFMSCIKWPDKTIEAVDRLRRAFLWKGDKKVKGGQCLVAWPTVTLNKEQGGLGIGDLRAHNLALLMRIGCRLLSDSSEPCFQWLRTQHMANEIPIKAKPTETPIWKTVCSVIEPIIASTKVTIGNGQLVQFWRDHWTAAGRFNLIYPTLASYATNINCTVSSQHTNGTWTIDLHPVLSSRAQTELQSLMDILLDQHIQQNVPDKRTLLLGSTDITTSANYNLLTYHGILWQPATLIWNKAIPNTCRIFLWLAFRDRLNTNANRVNKKWDSNPHCMSCPAIETANHIILRCKLAGEVWKKLNLYETAVRSSNIQDFVESILDTLPEHQKPGCPACFAACSHGLWKARNQLVFKLTETSVAYILHQIRESLQLWVHRLKPSLREHINTWADKLS
ncbi:hypothetical protein OsJ_23350 [Oryza sativa Japonica Group]|nr:hypothetical protein OsJ_23350 [Oryza sativa Japonica Group]